MPYTQVSLERDLNYRKACGLIRNWRDVNEGGRLPRYEIILTNRDELMIPPHPAQNRSRLFILRELYVFLLGLASAAEAYQAMLEAAEADGKP